MIQSCEIINPEESIPSYLHIEKIDLQITNALTQGSNSSNITDAWIYVDEQLIGTFELPATIPILKEGKSKLSVLAGIKKNGIAATRTDYPFYSFYINNSLVLSKGNVTIEDSVVVQYFEDINFAWIEDFEGATISIDSTDKSNVGIIIITDTALVFEGMASGMINLDVSDTIFYAISEKINVPVRGEEVYLEMNYKNDIHLYINLRSNLNSGFSESPIITINPSNGKWKKIYIELTDHISSNPNATDFQFKLFTDLGGLTSGTIYLDNFKLIHQ